MSELIANLAPAVGGIMVAAIGYLYARSLGAKSRKKVAPPAE
jgi:hypothetical protein